MTTKTIDLQNITPEDLRELLRDNTEIILMEGQIPIGLLSFTQYPPVTKPRVPNLNAGKIIHISDDFDDPFPDEFWFGDDNL